MRLQQVTIDHQVYQQYLDDLKQFIAQPDYKAKRACSLCQRPCGCSHSVSCTCQCKPDCSEALHTLSVEAQQSPIEARIAPLVYAVASLRLTQPYWSCEGHLNEQQQVRRYPQVWFHARSLMYPRLINDCLLNLYSQRKLKNPWHVSITFSGETLDCGFSIEPDVKVIPEPNLQALQHDAWQLGFILPEELKILAKDLIAKYPLPRAG